MFLPGQPRHPRASLVEDEDEDEDEEEEEEEEEERDVWSTLRNFVDGTGRCPHRALFCCVLFLIVVHTVRTYFSIDESDQIEHLTTNTMKVYVSSSSRCCCCGCCGCCGCGGSSDGGMAAWQRQDNETHNGQTHETADASTGPFSVVFYS